MAVEDSHHSPVRGLAPRSPDGAVVEEGAPCYYTRASRVMMDRAKARSRRPAAWEAYSPMTLAASKEDGLCMVRMKELPGNIP